MRTHKNLHNHNMKWPADFDGDCDPKNFPKKLKNCLFERDTKSIVFAHIKSVKEHPESSRLNILLKLFIKGLLTIKC